MIFALKHVQMDVATAKPVERSGSLQLQNLTKLLTIIVLFVAILGHGWVL